MTQRRSEAHRREMAQRWLRRFERVTSHAWVNYDADNFGRGFLKRRRDPKVGVPRFYRSKYSPAMLREIRRTHA